MLQKDTPHPHLKSKYSILRTSIVIKITRSSLMIHADDLSLSGQISAICLIRVEGDVLLLHRAGETRNLLKLLGLCKDTETQLVVIDACDLSAAGLDRLDGRFRGPGDLNVDGSLEVGLALLSFGNVSMGGYGCKCPNLLSTFDPGIKVNVRSHIPDISPEKL